MDTDASLDSLSLGETGVVTGYGRATQALKRQLAVFGILRGTPIKLTASAAFGGPIAVRVRGVDYGMSRMDAGNIRVLRGGSTSH